MRFYLGTHMPHWLERTDVPLFVARHRMPKRDLPRALGPWALDSGGFSALNNPPHRWTVTPTAYAAEVRRYHDEIGRMEWAAPQDWMCEPWIVAKTGLSVVEHQRRTIENYLTLRSIAPDLPFVPVLQGWKLDDYLRHIDAYEAAGVDLASEKPVGLGTVCRRQHTPEIGLIVATIAGYGLDLHGFGVKMTGLRAYAGHLFSADSLAWSDRGQHVHPLGCACTNCERGWSEPSGDHCGSTTHKGEANCLSFALAWRRRLLSVRPAPAQLAFVEAS